VTLRGGTVLGHKVDQPAGRTSANALPLARLREKFENCANRAISADRTAAAYAAIMELEKLGDVRAVNNAVADEGAKQRSGAAAKV
jgi:hypothetical protein